MSLLLLIADLKHAVRILSLYIHKMALFSPKVSSGKKTHEPYLLWVRSIQKSHLGRCQGPSQVGPGGWCRLSMCVFGAGVYTRLTSI